MIYVFEYFNICLYWIRLTHIVPTFAFLSRALWNFLYIKSCIPNENSCRPLKINVMKLVKISKDGQFHWLSFKIWTRSVASISRELQAFLRAMLRPICEAYQSLMTILCIFYMLNIGVFWHGTLKIGLPLMSRNIIIYD